MIHPRGSSEKKLLTLFQKLLTTCLAVATKQNFMHQILKAKLKNYQ